MKLHYIYIYTHTHTHTHKRLVLIYREINFSVCVCVCIYIYIYVYIYTHKILSETVHTLVRVTRTRTHNMYATKNKNFVNPNLMNVIFILFNVLGFYKNYQLSFMYDILIY